MNTKNNNFDIEKDLTSEKYFNPLTRGMTKKFIGNLLSEIRNLEINSLLDVGCGTGYITEKLKSYASSSVGCDLDRSRIKFAKSQFHEISWMLTDAVKLPFKSYSFDMVASIELLEHVRDTKSLLKEIKRVSKEFVLITVPNEPRFRIANFLRGKNIRRFGNIEGHIHHFNKRSLKLLLSEHFSEIDIKVNAFFWISALCQV